MSAISPDNLVALKAVLEERYVSFLPDLIARVDTSEEDRKKKQIARVFNAFVVQKYFDTSAQDAAAAVIDNFEDNGIDAIYYDAKSKCLALVQSKLHKSKDFGQVEAGEFKTGVELFLKLQFDTFNQNFHDRLREVERNIDECESIVMVIACTGNQISHHAKTRLNNFAATENSDDNRLSNNVVYLESEQLAGYLLEEQSMPSITADLRIDKSQETTNSRRMVHGVISLHSLVVLHNLHNKALYDKNIRYFLGSKKSNVNSAIKNTLEKQPGNFLYLNNGITALCDSLHEKNLNSRTVTHTANGLSIVNGAQTIASAAEYLEQNPEADISEAKVMFSLIHAPSSDNFHGEVTIARNFQNPVHSSNFVSLDPRQESIRKSLKLHGYNYHYRPEALGSSRDPKNLTIDDVIIALACLLPDPRHAVWLKSDQLRYRDQSNQGYQTIFSGEVSAFRIINAYECYKIIRSVVTSNARGAGGTEKLIYRHGAFVFCYLLMKRLKNRIEAKILVDEAEIRALISDPLDTLRQRIADGFVGDNAGEHRPLGLFKNITYGTPYVVELLQWQAQLNDSDAQAANRLKAQQDVKPATNDTVNTKPSDEAYGQLRHIKFIISKTAQL